MSGERWRGSGRDLLVLAREPGGWLVVWRTLMSGPEEEIGEVSGDASAAHP